MTEEEMYDSLLAVFENMTYDKDPQKYSHILALLDDMRYFLHTELMIDYPTPTQSFLIRQGVFDF